MGTFKTFTVSISNYYSNQLGQLTFNHDGDIPIHKDDEWEIYHNSMYSFGKKINGIINGVQVLNECEIIMISVDQFDQNRLNRLVKLMEISNRHSNIARVYGFSFGMGRLGELCLYIYIENLNDYIHLNEFVKNENGLKEDTIKTIINQVIGTLAELYEDHHIIHGDFKSSNLIYNPVSGNIKLVGFGCYSSIELDHKLDISRVGNIILELYCKEILLSFSYRDILSHLSSECKNFIQNCFIEDPQDRPKAVELTNHEFLNNSPKTKEPVASKDIEKLSVHIKTTTSISKFKYDKDSIVSLFNSIPTTSTHLILHDFNQDPQPLKLLPITVTSLSLPSFNKHIEKESIPLTIRELIFGKDYDFNGYTCKLPHTIKRFTSSYNFILPLPRENQLPTQVSILVLDCYNKPITANSIPSTVHTLTLGSNYKHFKSLSNLPSSVFNLTFGVSNQCTLTNDQIKQLIPSSMTRITITRSDINNQSQLLHQDIEWEIDYAKPLGNDIYGGRKLNGKINGISMDNNGECAIKIIKNIHSIDEDLILELVEITKDYFLYMVKVYGYSYGPSNQIPTTETTPALQSSRDLYIYMEYLKDYTNLSDFIQLVGMLDEEEIRSIVIQLLYAINKLRSYDIIHRDIKISNIMYHPEKNVIKLIGFNHTREFELSLDCKRSDISSIGCAIIEMAGGNLNTRDNYDIPDHLSNDCKDLIEACLKKYEGLDIEGLIDVFKNKEFKHDDEWVVDKELGKGAFSLVYKARKLDCKIDNKVIPNYGLCAIKKIPNTLIGKYEIETLPMLKEISSNHTNIIKIYGYSFGDLDQQQPPKRLLTKSIRSEVSSATRDLYIYMEYKKDYIDLLEYVNINGPLNECEIKNITNQLIDTLAELNEDHQIIHRDIKSNNIMYNPSTGNIKLIDFGLSKEWIENSQFETMVGTQLYTAPEVLLGNSTASSRSDIWSVGCTLIQIAGGDLRIKKDSTPIDIPSHLSIHCRHFIQKCLIFDPKERPKAIDLINHRFLNNNSTELNESRSHVELKLKNISTTTTHLKVTKFKYDKDSIIALFNCIATTVTHLILQDFNQDIELLKLLPASITSLSLPEFNHYIEDESIPETLEELIFGEAFQLNDHGDNLPDTIKRFTCSFNFIKPLTKNNNIPKRVSTLVLDNYNQPITKGSIPSTVHTLTLGSNYQHFSSLSNLPTSVFNLTFGISNECTLTNDQIKLIPSRISNVTIVNQPPDTIQ